MEPPVSARGLVAIPPPGSPGHEPAAGQFREFKPPAGLGTWDSSPFTDAPARRGRRAAFAGRRWAPSQEASPGGTAVAAADRTCGPGWRCRCGSSGLTRRSRTRPSTCGPGIWSGPGGCMVRDPRLPHVFLGGARPLPAYRGPRRQCGRTRRRPPAVTVLHARGHVAPLGHGGPAVRAKSGAPGRGLVRHPGRHTAPRRLRDLRRDGAVPAGAGRDGWASGPQTPGSGPGLPC